MEIILIRHGKTQGNLAGRYIGRTDEPLAKEGADALACGQYPAADAVVSSPMLRCKMTAGIIYPDKTPVIYDDLRECDFGTFEGKTNEQLKDDPLYIKWIENAGDIPFPDGEDAKTFRRRCCAAFERAVRENVCERLAFVVHGGVIMAVMDRYCTERRSFYGWHVKNGCGYVCRWDENTKNLYIREEFRPQTQFVWA